MDPQSAAPMSDHLSRRYARSPSCCATSSNQQSFPHTRAPHTDPSADIARPTPAFCRTVELDLPGSVTGATETRCTMPRILYYSLTDRSLDTVEIRLPLGS